MSEDVRARIVVGAADMIRRRGLSATSIRELAKHADAPLGSTYHYFPGGKHQVAAEAVQLSGDLVSGVLARRLEAGPAEGVRAFLAHWRKLLVETDFRAGCPVLAVSVEDGVDDEGGEVRAVAAGVFSDWQVLLATALREDGAGRKQADQVATMVISATEGAIALCRAHRSTRPLDQVADQLEGLIRGISR